MKICHISDTHGKHRKLPIDLNLEDIDLLIHSGDITWTGDLDILADFNAWLGEFRFIKHKIVIAGNHDLSLENNSSFAKQILNNSIYLDEELVEIDGYKIYGSAWTPRFGSWAFYEDRGPKIRYKWRHLINGIIKPDILVTHGPPKGILDEIETRRVGCEGLLEAVNISKPKLHVFGHIHKGYGSFKNEHTSFLNSSICDEQYRPRNKPQFIEL